MYGFMGQTQHEPTTVYMHISCSNDLAPACVREEGRERERVITV